MENVQKNEKGKLTAEQALKMLREEKLDVTLEQAGKILEFLRMLASVTVSNFLNDKDEKDSRPLCESKYRRTGRKRIFTKKPRGDA
ncbi:hypothetical protein ACQ9BO_07815 [Flavobacterium sp. P21]|uniref:hypothetical protein n=1 Tax=Flavobacterium sp. P21 TaxID=3423948 RepID=UPI003D6713CE